MLRNLSLISGLLAVAACFPDLAQYEGEGEGAAASTTGAAGSTSSQPASSGTDTSTSTSTSPTGSTGTGDGGSGPGPGGGPTASGDPTSSSSTSSSGGGGGSVDPCLRPIDQPLVQAGSLIEGESQGEAYAFCMDRAEVSHEQYRVFFDDVAAGNFELDDALTDVPHCAWKPITVDALVPAFDDMFQSDWIDTTYPDVPMVGIDVCDATAYCAWSGKRLCGGINGLDLGAPSQQPKNEWYLACSHDGQRLYPYNDDGEFDEPASACINGTPDALSCPAYDPDRCASGGVCGGWRGLWTEDESATCGAFAPGVVNLAGNVGEWLDACSPDEDKPSGWRCEQRGGSCGGSEAGGYYTSCAWAQNGSAATDASARSNFYGFRCCWDPEAG